MGQGQGEGLCILKVFDRHVPDWTDCAEMEVSKRFHALPPPRHSLRELRDKHLPAQTGRVALQTQHGKQHAIKTSTTPASLETSPLWRCGDDSSHDRVNE